MGKRILRVYLAKNDTPYSAAYAKLELPASPWEVWDAMEKVRLQTDDILYMEIEDYFAFEYLSPHLDGLDISLNELNDLAAQLAALDEVQGIAFEGMFSIAVQKKVNANGGVITLQDLRDLAVSAKTVLTRKKHIKSFACKQKKRISHKVCRTEIFLGVEPEYHRANIKCVFSSELKMRRNREENKAVPINLF